MHEMLRKQKGAQTYRIDTSLNNLDEHMTCRRSTGQMTSLFALWS